MTATTTRTRRCGLRRWAAGALVVVLAVAAGAPRVAAAAGGAPPQAAHRRARKAAIPAAPASRDAGRALGLQRRWGIDVVGVRRVSSGYMLRFDYRVVDPVRAAALADHAVRPYLLDEATGTALSVPAMENVGELRQVGPPQRDRTYFIIFGNPGGLVKRGGRVTLVAGNLRAEGLVVGGADRLAGVSP